MSTRLGRVSAPLLDALLPIACAVCGARVASDTDGRPRAFCAPCEAALPWWRRADGCPRCGAREGGDPSNADRAGAVDGGGASGDVAAGCAGCLARQSPLHASHAGLRYSGDVARWIPALKRPATRRPPPMAVLRAIDRLALVFGERIDRTLRGRIDLVASLPLHPRRRRARGFNQADVLARPIAAALGVPFEPELLERVRDTPPQAALVGRARLVNVRGAFRARRPLPDGLRVAVVDDVLTSGASLEAAAEALLRANALEVRGLALAATLPRGTARPVHPVGRAGPGGAS